MKYNLLLIIFSIAHAFGQTHEWSATYGPSVGYTSIMTVVDSANNVYVVGNYQGTIDIDPSASVLSFISAGSKDIFIQKFDDSGAMLWAKTIGGTSEDFVNSVIINGNEIVLSGFFNNTVDFDPGVLISNEIASVTNESFILSLDVNGDFINVISTPVKIDTSYEFVVTTKVDNSGNIITGGNVSLWGTNAWYDMDPTAIVNNVYFQGLTDGYIQKLTPAGTLEWAFAIGHDENDINDMEGIGDIEVDSAGNIYVVGRFSNTVNFNPLGVTSNQTVVPGLIMHTDGYVAKYSPAGILQWFKQIGNGQMTYCMKIKIVDSSLYVTGNFNQTLDFGNSNVVTASGINDSYILKLTMNGVFEDVHTLESQISLFKIHELISDSSNNIYICATFNEDIDVDFGPDTLILSPTTSGITTSMIAKYNSSGDLFWAYAIENPDSINRVNSLALDAANSIVFVGFHSGNSDFDLSDSVYVLPSVGAADYYISKFTQDSIALQLSVTPTECTFGFCDGTASYSVVGGISPITYSILGSPNWTNNLDTLCQGYYTMVAQDFIGNTDTVNFYVFIDNYYNYIDTTNLIGDSLLNWFLDDCFYNYSSDIDSADLLITVIDSVLNIHSLEITIYQANGSITTLTDTIYSNLSPFQLIDITLYCSDTIKAPLKVHRLLFSLYDRIGYAGLNDKTPVSSSYRVYPNPLETLLRIDMEIIDEQIELKLIDNAGRNIPITYESGKHIEVDVSHLVSGTYFLLLKSSYSENSEIIKLVKLH